MSQPPKPPRTPPPNTPEPAGPVLRGLGIGDAETGNPLVNMPTLVPPPAHWAQPNGLVGQVFGDFELTAEIGRGGMGVVYKAIQRSLDRAVALKLLLAEFATNPPMLTRFLSEARAAASLTHPNIISIYQVGESAAGPYFVMEFIDGPSLEDLLKRTLPVPWTVSLLATVAEAVQHAHDKHIIHRDLKPGNIMLHQQKRPVVMDFGIAKLTKRGGNLTSPGSLIGTPAYMPPEQAGEDPTKVGPHSDVYSLGAILYTLLSGSAPFDEGSALKTILKVISASPPVPVRAYRPEVPHRLEQIVMKCLEKDIAKRYSSAQALAEDLKRLRATLQQTKPSAVAMRVTLPSLVLYAEGGKPVRLTNASSTIGRAPECDLVLKSSQVSKKHCRILLSNDTAMIEDLGSVNGTFLNGEQIEPNKRIRLADGDQLDIAEHLFTVELKPAE